MFALRHCLPHSGLQALKAPRRAGIRHDHRSSPNHQALAKVPGSGQTRTQREGHVPQHTCPPHGHPRPGGAAAPRPRSSPRGRPDALPEARARRPAGSPTPSPGSFPPTRPPHTGLHGRNRLSQAPGLRRPAWPPFKARGRVQPRTAGPSLPPGQGRSQVVQPFPAATGGRENKTLSLPTFT